MSKIYIIGAGGVGSWITPALCMLAKPENITIVDGDKLELKNLSRQLYHDVYIGENKANSLAKQYDCLSDPRYFVQGNFATERDDWFMERLAGGIRHKGLHHCHFIIG